MGSSNLNCAISNFPINREEKVICIFLSKGNNSGHLQPYYPWGTWQFSSLPFIVEMGDYSTPIGVLDCEGSESGEFDTFNKLDKSIYEDFKRFIYAYRIEKNGEKRVIDLNTLDSREHWYHVIRYGNYERYIGYSPYYNPKLVKSDNLNYQWFGKFDPKDIGISFINLEVFKYLTRPIIKKNNKYESRLEEFFRLIDSYRKLTSKEEKIKSELRFSLFFSRFEHLEKDLSHRWTEILIDTNTSEESVKKIKNKMEQLWILSTRLWDIQQPIVPSHGLSPQCGWHNDLKTIKQYHKKLIDIYDKRVNEYQ